MSFEALGLAPGLLSALAKAGFDEPTSVQAAAIPRALAGHDLMVSSQTGSGKTAAFMLPALQRIAGRPANKGSGVQVLVLTPTRELAMQVSDATRQYGAQLKDLRIATVVGGMPYGAQIKALSRRVDVLVATPGRLIDHLQARRVNLSTVHTLVLDEADRMLDMGFIEDIESIIERLPQERQTLLFSATLDGTVARLAAKMMNEPQRIEISSPKQRHDSITQSLLYADDSSHKMRLLDHLLRDANMEQAIVFTSTKRGADELADRLADQGFAAAALHGDMNQRQRTRTLGMLQKGRLRILVATDVAARGIDVQGISHAVNFDLPMQAEDYVHRIGRTGRAGRSGLAYTLATQSERHKIRRIEHFIGQPIPSQVIPGLEPKKAAPRPTYTERKGSGRKFAGRGGYGDREARPARGYDKGRRADGEDFRTPTPGFRPDRQPGAQHAGRNERDANPWHGASRGAREENPWHGSGRNAYEGNPRQAAARPEREAKPWHGAREDRPWRDTPRHAESRGEKPAFRERNGEGYARDRAARPAFGDRPARTAPDHGRHADAAGRPGRKPAGPRPAFGKKPGYKPAARRSHA
ncbi:DEAD/DEAH box helicase [Candidimonas nitroreducens]|uniref:RNA helicase n=1 Tax=Candidimonas nitroreducens TaxID=683354 RepID=A0A225MH89_9BURK|nr:DEAD/DEAH box helicase [Candidimonas nitroreducens]OWT59310.1 RNA helicase [Candidimonas nitroreducens]